MISSERCGPYESAVSIKLTPSSTDRWSTRTASSRSLGGPQIPEPVSRMAPKPMRLTVRPAPSVMVPAAAAGTVIVFGVAMKVFLGLGDLAACADADGE